MSNFKFHWRPLSPLPTPMDVDCGVWFLIPLLADLPRTFLFVFKDNSRDERSDSDESAATPYYSRMQLFDAGYENH